LSHGRDLEQLRASFQGVSADKIAFVELDVSNEAQAETAVHAAVSQFGRIDVLVNNAGYGLMGNFEEVASSAVERQFATNGFGLMHVTRAVLPVMRRQRSGHIFNLAQASEAVVDAAARLMELMAQPVEANLLAPLVIDEILIRLLRSAVGGRLAQLGQAESNVHSFFGIAPGRDLSRLRDTALAEVSFT
jgi:NAD(P)-dependent dehydrogenase (short-subunit alcohol dehydrogenase family)